MSTVGSDRVCSQGAQLVKAARRDGRSVAEVLASLVEAHPTLGLAPRLALLLDEEYGGYPLVEVCHALLAGARTYPLQQLVKALALAGDGPHVAFNDVARALAAPAGGVLSAQEIARALHVAHGGPLSLYTVAVVLSDVIALGRSPLETVNTLQQLVEADGEPEREDFFIKLIRQTFTLSEAEATALDAEARRMGPMAPLMQLLPPLSVVYQATHTQCLWQF